MPQLPLAADLEGRDELVLTGRDMLKHNLHGLSIRPGGAFGRLVWVSLLALFLAFDATAAELETQPGRTFDFPAAGISFSTCFDSARLSDCTQQSETEYQVLIRPENKPINDSAWYAFSVKSRLPRTITVKLSYRDGKHRYHPKTSRDGRAWTPLAEDAYSHDENGAVLRLQVGPEPLWVAGQELIGGKQLNAWIDKMGRLPFAKTDIVGHSILDRPIRRLVLTDGPSPGSVFILGRQHPPEVTGSLGLMNFVETIAGESELAQEFRRSFEVVVVPLINPDGVQQGHWRHNMRGVDLNRDWGIFKQPETRSVAEMILEYEKKSMPRPYLLIDFHSTRRDIFYTQTDGQTTDPPDFCRNWLGAIADRLPDYKVRRSASAVSKSATSKKWGYETLGIPSITYEFGDNTDRRLICRVSEVAAEEMMRLLLVEIAATVPAERNLQPAAAVD
jgi:hypothetical protein